MTRYQYAIIMVDTDGQDLLISRHTTLEKAEAQLAWLGFGNARIVEAFKWLDNGKPCVSYLEVEDDRA